MLTAVWYTNGALARLDKCPSGQPSFMMFKTIEPWEFLSSENG